MEVCPLPYTTRLSTVKILMELEMWDEATQVIERNTVVSRFSGLRFSGLSRFSGLFLLLDRLQKWSNHTIGIILFSGLSRFSGHFVATD